MMAPKLSPSLVKIVDILGDGALHAGTDIATRVGVSRAMVWKAIQHLKRYDVEITSQHQGYALNTPLILLDKEKIQTFLATTGATVDVFETLSSTSDYLKAQPPSQKIKICLAEHQSRGRGRLGRSWASPFGRNIYCSFTYTFRQDASALGGLSMVVGVLMARALALLDPRMKPQLKWPNDLYFNGKKAGGILIELVAEAHGNCHAIISFGLNVNMKNVSLQGVDREWTSLEEVVGEKLDRNRILEKSLGLMFEGLQLFQEEGLPPFLREWEAYDVLKGRDVSLNIGKEILSGKARGVDSEGYLLLERPSGEVGRFCYGDASLLKF